MAKLDPIVEHQRVKSDREEGRGSSQGQGDMELVDVESGMFSQLQSGSGTPVIAGGGGGGGGVSVGSGGGVSVGSGSVSGGPKSSHSSMQERGQGQAVPTRSSFSRPLSLPFSSGVKKDENRRRSDPDTGRTDRGECSSEVTRSEQRSIITYPISILTIT